MDYPILKALEVGDIIQFPKKLDVVDVTEKCSKITSIVTPYVKVTCNGKLKRYQALKRVVVTMLGQVQWRPLYFRNENFEFFFGNTIVTLRFIDYKLYSEEIIHNVFKTDTMIDWAKELAGKKVEFVKNDGLGIRYIGVKTL